MELREQREGEIAVVEVLGRIDTQTAKEFTERLCAQLRLGARAVVLDLKQLLYISSAGFRALLIAAKLAEENHVPLALCGLGAEVKRLFDLGGFSELLPIHESREAALAKT